MNTETKPTLDTDGSIQEAALSPNTAGSNPTDNPQEMSEKLGWAAWLVVCQGFQVRGCSCEIFSLPLEILKQIDCLVWSRRGPSKTESISTLWNIILLDMVVQRQAELHKLEASPFYIETYHEIYRAGDMATL